MSDDIALRARELLRTITPGEWEFRGGGQVSAQNPQKGKGQGFTIGTEMTPVCNTHQIDFGSGSDDDARFIAAAPALIAALCDELDRVPSDNAVQEALALDFEDKE